MARIGIRDPGGRLFLDAGDKLKEPAMTTPTAPTTRPQPDPYLDTPHQHTRSCFWDYLECRWQCPRATPANPHDPTRDAH